MEKVVRTPIDERDVEKLKIRDIVYIDGIIITARDMTHRLIIEKLRKGELDPKMFEGGVIYHAGPVVKREGQEWKIISIGPTTSLRMDKYIPQLLELVKVRLIVGKGGLGPRSEEAVKKHKCIYGIFPGGCGIVAAQKVKRVIDVLYLEELGIPEAMWILEVEKFGPIVITVAP
ncbi:MAG: fumarate hydratase [Crenarchaeota archaeon]|nr:fumarate hydratase [Thermoproteota archaeon]